MSKISKAQLDDFCKKVKHFKEDSLTAEQGRLLDQIFKVAWNAIPHEDPLEEFDGCFEPDQAAIILNYTTSGPVELLHSMVKHMADGMVRDTHRP